MQGIRIVVLVIGLAVVVLGVSALGTSGLDGRFIVDEMERTFAASTTRQLTLRGFNGRMTYEAWDGDDIRIAATTRVSAPFRNWAERLAGRVHVEVNEADGHVRVEVERTVRWMLFGHAAVQFQVYVPRDWVGGASLTTSNGPIAVRDGAGDAVVRTSNGLITVDGYNGTLEARTSNGRIELSRFSGVLQAHSSNGALRMTDVVLSGSGQIRTSNGAITLLARLTEDADYGVRTSNGSVDVMLSRPDVALDLSTSNGRINLQTEVNVSRVDRRRVAGRIGSGAATLNVQTSNGSISLGERP